VAGHCGGDRWRGEQAGEGPRRIRHLPAGQAEEGRALTGRNTQGRRQQFSQLPRGAQGAGLNPADCFDRTRNLRRQCSLREV
jgi:hypothetical protein